MYALILTNHFLEIGGSEMVTADVAEVLDDMGYQVDIFCNALSAKMIQCLKEGISVTDNIEDININKYDFIWTQHGVVGLFLDQLNGTRVSQTVVSAHLSPFENHEHIGVMSALMMQAKIVANSEETKNYLNEYGVPSIHTYNFKNSVPNNYFNENIKIPEKIQSIAIISNHIPDELFGAVNLLLKNGIQVKIFGKGHNYTRLKREHLDDVDAVITIGRSVQYALCSGKPVYCYDIWGGPGWLNLDNFFNAEKFNFSGRCCGRKITSEQLFAEIYRGFFEVINDLKFIHEYALKNYSLENCIKDLLAISAPNYNDVDYAKIIMKTSIDHSSVIRKVYRYGFLR
jgi:hypothetical protein